MQRYLADNTGTCFYQWVGGPSFLFLSKEEGGRGRKGPPIDKNKCL